MKLVDGDPFPFSISAAGAAMINIKNKFEVREGLTERSD